MYIKWYNLHMAKKNITLPVGILVGAIAGAVAGVLLAPASGVETRKKLKDLTTKMKADLEKRLGGMKEITTEAYGKVVDAVVEEYSAKEPIVKKNATKLKEMLKGKFKSSTTSKKSK